MNFEARLFIYTVLTSLILGYCLSSYPYWKHYYELYNNTIEEKNIRQRLVLGEAPHDIVCDKKEYYFKSDFHLDRLLNGEYRKYKLSIPKYDTSLSEVYYDDDSNSTYSYIGLYRCFCGCNTDIPDKIKVEHM